MVQLLLEAARGLAYLHSRGIIHGGWGAAAAPAVAELGIASALLHDTTLRSENVYKGSLVSGAGVPLGATSMFLDGTEACAGA